MSALHICAPEAFSFRTVRWCPTCEQKRRMVVHMYVWYGPSVLCCACGEAWHDGYRAPRPFKRGWRAEASAEARRAYVRATLTKKQALSMLMNEVAVYTQRSVETADINWGVAASGSTGGDTQWVAR